MSPYQIVFGKACHLPIKIEHRAYWAIKKFNMTYNQASQERKLQLHELEQMCLEAYENSRIEKQKARCFDRVRGDSNSMLSRVPHKCGGVTRRHCEHEVHGKK
ncbi:hypothetical protein CR513_12786, partial [Mucuna pruriens]